MKKKTESACVEIQTSVLEHIKGQTTKKKKKKDKIKETENELKSSDGNFETTTKNEYIHSLETTHKSKSETELELSCTKKKKKRRKDRPEMEKEHNEMYDKIQTLVLEDVKEHVTKKKKKKDKVKETENKLKSVDDENFETTNKSEYIHSLETTHKSKREAELELSHTKKKKKRKKDRPEMEEEHVDTNSPKSKKRKIACVEMKEKQENGSEKPLGAMHLLQENVDATECSHKDSLTKLREKKKEKRKQKQLEKNAAVKQSQSGSMSENQALKYLRLWHEDKETWKFQKVRQVWLLQNMFNSKQVFEDDFKLLLQYLEGLKGKAREATLAEAEKIVSVADEEEETTQKDTEDISGQISSEKYERARQVIQILS